MEELQLPKEIDFNFEEIKKELSEKVKTYESLVYTDETIKEAKEDRAKLNKFKEALETKRKDVKNTCLVPYQAFEIKMKELTGLVDIPIKSIDEQVKSYEQRLKDEKQVEIETYFNEKIGSLKDSLTLSMIFDSKWLNLTVKKTQVFEQIDQKIEKISLDLDTIDDLKNEDGCILRDYYLRTLDITATFREKNRLEELRKVAMQKAEAQEAVKEKIIEPITGPIQNQVEQFPNNAEQKIYYRKFFVRGTKEQLIAVAQFMDNNGIEYGGLQECQSKIA